MNTLAASKRKVDIDVNDITVSGTVDGRDVAIDGTKLDGIEAGATADQTAAEILTAIKTVDGSGSGLDADLLDGQHASEFAAASHNHDSISTGLTVHGSHSRGSYTAASQYHTGADNLVLKGNASGISGIFFESEKDGTNINHSSDFGFLQYHAYGTGTTGESNELILGVSNDGDDNVVLNAPSVNGLKYRIGASETDYTVWHSGNDGSGSGLDADLLDGLDSSQFLRSDQNDTTSGILTFGPNTSWGKYLKIGGNANNSDANSGSIGVTNGNLHLDAAISHTTYLNFYDGTGGVAFGNGAGANVAWMGPDGDLWKGSADNTGSKYWHAGNDGSGSGLDADLLDGIDSSQFLRSDASDAFTSGALTFNSGTHLKGNDAAFSGFFMAQNPEGQHVASPFFFNDMAYARLRGATVTVMKDAIEVTDTGIKDAMFNANGDFWNMSTSGVTTVEITLTSMPKGLTHGAHMGLTFGNPTWRAKNVKLEYSTDGGSTWTAAIDLTGQSEEFVIAGFSTGATQTNALRWTLSDFNTTSLRIVSLFAYNYNSTGMEDLYVTRDGGEVYAPLTTKGGINGLTLENGGISGSNFNITGVNELVINDPGEGIRWSGGANSVTLANIDDATDSIMNFSGASEVRRDGNKMWDAGNDGSGSGLDADLLDGQQGSYYTGYTDTAIANLADSAPATLDTLNELAAALGDDPNFATTVTNSIAGKVAKSGDTMTGNLSFGDNNKVIFGAGSDLQIYHNGAESVIHDSGTGNLDIRADSLSLLNAAGSEYYARFYTNGAANLYHDGSLKLNTNSTGVDVTGTVTADGLNSDGNVNVGSSSQTSGNQTLTIYGYDTSASTAKYGRLQVGGDGSFLVSAQDTYLQLSAANYIQSSSTHNFIGHILFSGDTNLYRTSANNLRTDDSFTVGTDLTVNGTTTHSGLTMTSGTDIDQLHTVTLTYTAGTGWTDTGINGIDLATGSYIVQIHVDDQTGHQYNERYTGTMSWYSGNTNDTSVDEIVLHSAGHADNDKAIYLRTIRTADADPDDLKLQISADYTGVSTTVTLKFRRMI